MLRVLSGIVGRRLNRRCLRDDLEMVTKLLGKYMLIELPGRIREGELCERVLEIRTLFQRKSNLTSVLLSLAGGELCVDRLHEPREIPSGPSLESKEGYRIGVGHAGRRSFYGGSQPKGNSTITQHFPLIFQEF